jgi:hypothetical protein
MRFEAINELTNCCKGLKPGLSFEVAAATSLMP